MSIVPDSSESTDESTDDESTDDESTDNDLEGSLRAQLTTVPKPA